MTVLLDDSKGTEVSSGRTDNTCKYLVYLSVKSDEKKPWRKNSPTMAANSKIQKFSKYENSRPDKTISPDPAKSILLRPTRSATIVKKSPKKTSPRSVRVMKRPI